MKSLFNKVNREEMKVLNKKEGIKEIDYKVIEAVGFKALKVVMSKGNRYAMNIVERYFSDKKADFEDIIQEIVLAVLENGYIYKDKLTIKSHCFKLKEKRNNFKWISRTSKKVVFKNINKIFYRERKIVDTFISYNTYINEKEEYIEKLSYNKFITSYNNSYNKESFKKIGFKIDDLNLTERQKEVLNIYTKYNSYERVAEILGISRQAVNYCINSIKSKINKKTLA